MSEKSENSSLDSLKDYDILSDPDGATWDELTSYDAFLSSLMDGGLGVDDEYVDASFGLTLSTTGGVVTGLMIPRGEWIEGVADEIATANKPFGDAFRDVWTKFSSDVSARSKRRRDEGLPPMARGFIHLKQARVYAGANWINVGFWRGRLSEVSGWSMGTPGD